MCALIARRGDGAAARRTAPSLAIPSGKTDSTLTDEQNAMAAWFTSDISARDGETPLSISRLTGAVSRYSLVTVNWPGSVFQKIGSAGMKILWRCPAQMLLLPVVLLASRSAARAAETLDAGRIREIAAMLPEHAVRSRPADQPTAPPGRRLRPATRASTM